MTDGVALNGRPLSEVAADHAALFSGIPSAYDGINEFNGLLRQAMQEHLQGKEGAVDTFRLAMRERAALLTAPEIRRNDDARSYLQGIVVTHESPEEALAQTVAMHGFVDDWTYKGEPVAAEADGSDPDEPIAIL